MTEGPQYHYNTMVLTGLSLAAEGHIHQMWSIAEGAVFDKSLFEKFLTKLQSHPAEIFGELPVHYETVGHWLRTDADKHLGRRLARLQMTAVSQSESSQTK